MTTTYSEGGITQLMRARYAAPEWAFLSQVRNKTGLSGMRERYLDGLAIGLYPSRGMEMHGFEIKVSRSDWKHELGNPAKAEGTAQYLDRFWVVTPKDLVRPGELPVTWGWLSVDGDKVKIEVQAPTLTPIPLNRTFVASIMRNFDEQWVPKRELNDRVEARVAEHRKDEETRDNSVVEELQKKLIANQELLRKFQVATGRRLEDWSVGVIASAIRIVMDNTERDSLLKKKKQYLQDYTFQVERLTKEVETLENVEKNLDTPRDTR